MKYLYNNLDMKIEFYNYQIMETVDKIVNSFYRFLYLKRLHNRSYVAVGILKACMPFMWDVLARMPMLNIVDTQYMDIKSYAGISNMDSMYTNMNFLSNLEMKNVILFDTIIDTGNTIQEAIYYLETLHVNSIKICSLIITKEAKKRFSHLIDNYQLFYGFEKEVSNFYVGYGLDYNNNYRTKTEIYKII